MSVSLFGIRFEVHRTHAGFAFGYYDDGVFCGWGRGITIYFYPSLRLKVW